MNATAQLTWLDLTAADRDKVRRVLDLFKEQGTVDELGLGSLRDTLANALFPGTSVLHTRLRYILFIPWIYRQIEAAGTGQDVAREGRRLETLLIESLASSDDQNGIIGRIARESLSRLASNAYWAALVQWGVFLPRQSQAWYHTHFDSLLRRGKSHQRADDPGVIWTHEPTWHPRLPPAPKSFPADASFALTRHEADFVQGRIEERCPRMLLAWLAREGSASLADAMWEEPVALNAGDAITHIVELARRFSLHVEGGPLLYNLLLAELRQELHGSEKDAELIERYRASLSVWADQEAQESPFRTDDLWRLVAEQGSHVRHPQRSFVEAWSRRVQEIGAHGVVEDKHLRRLIASREKQLKGPRRARVSNPGRLLDWSGATGLGRMQFRWPQVRRLMIDLHRGLDA